MTSFDTELNRMSVRRFYKIIRKHPELKVSFEQLKPVKYNFLKVLTMVPLVRELFTGTVVCRMERVGGSG